MKEYNVERKKKILIELMIDICLLFLVFFGSYIFIKGIIDNSINKIDNETEQIILGEARKYVESDELNKENQYKEFYILLSTLSKQNFKDDKFDIKKYQDEYIVKVTIKNNEYNYMSLCIYEYSKPNYGINVLEFYKHCERGNNIIIK